MLKKILIGVGVVVILLVAAFLYLNNRNRSLSPAGEVSLENEGVSVAIEYSRPSVRNRLIFGDEGEGALLPYGVYWRLGANEPTKIAVNVDFPFGDKVISQGKYTIYAFPRKGEMELVLNSEVAFWGYSEPEHANDIATVVIPMQVNEKTEQFTIKIDPVKRGVKVVFLWDTYRWELPVVKQ